MTEKIKKKTEFKDIWDVLYNVDIKPYMNKKMDLDFVSWARIYTIMAEQFPNFEWGNIDHEGMPYKTLPNGTAQVTTFVEIDGVRREMTLPVMDNRMKSTTNVDATVVNKNVWRCFVKNCAIFGLGMRVYSTLEEDLNDIGTQPEKEIGKELSESPKPKATIQPKDSSKNIKETLTPYEDGYPTDKVDTKKSEMFLELVDKYLDSDNLTSEELSSFYSNETNKPQFDKLKKELPDYYKAIIEKFKSVKQSLENKETN